MTRQDIRNIAIIAHVDHGKTTLVDQLLKQNGVFREGEAVADRVMDSNALERERGITILAKNTAVHYNGVKINIIDTPGHADFGGEVERILSMVDGVLLLVDAVEGCMPQTRYVLKKALGLNKKPVVVINKVDRGCDHEKIVDEVLDLFLELGANDEQIDFKVVYASAKFGWATLLPGTVGVDMRPLLDTIVSQIPAPEGDDADGLQAIVCNVDYDDYVGRIGIGKIVRGTIRSGQLAALCHTDGSVTHEKIVKLYQFEGLRRVEADRGTVGDIIALSGIRDLGIGETVCDVDKPDPLPFVAIDEPTLSMTFMVNDSPFAGKEGKFVTSRHLRARLFREVMTNVGMRVKETDTTEAFEVFGRGELHLSILIETMRREGYEFAVSKPEVIFKKVDGQTLEPYENLIIDVPQEYAGSVIEKLASRKAQMQNMETGEKRTNIDFLIPARGLIGFRSDFVRITKGEGIMYHTFSHYGEYAGDIPRQRTGSLIAFEDGEAIPYALHQFEDRGVFFVTPKTKVYRGMIVGECNRPQDLAINICKTKKLTNMRSATADVMVTLQAPKIMGLEDCLEYIAEDELVEVTPKNVRMRKANLNFKK